MKKGKNNTQKQNGSNRLILDDILNSNAPEIKQFMANAMKEEMSQINPNAPEEEINKAIGEANERILVRMGWRFKDKLSPRMQRILEEQYPNPDAA